MITNFTITNGNYLFYWNSETYCGGWRNMYLFMNPNRPIKFYPIILLANFNVAPMSVLILYWLIRASTKFRIL